MRKLLNWISFSASHEITALPSDKSDKIFLGMLA